MAPAAALVAGGAGTEPIDPQAVSVFQAGLSENLAEALHRLSLPTLGDVCGEMRAQLAGMLTRQGAIPQGKRSQALDELETVLRTRWGLHLLTGEEVRQRQQERRERWRRPVFDVVPGGGQPPPRRAARGLNILGGSLGLDKLHASGGK